MAAWLPVAALTGAIFYVSSLSTVPTPEIPGFDKVEHFATYALLAWLSCRAFAATGMDARWGVVLASFYGLSDELHQAFVPGRSSDVFDWVADTAGGAAALFLYLRHTRRAPPSAAADGERAHVPVSRP
ncbi:MAG TPA: VanZ family protein [Longimicrobiaceae bacterium]|nr:VanZ family protein [Longimicrobiaceae bacterium]